MKKINKTELHQIFIGMKTDNQNSYNLLYEKYYKLVYGIVFSIIKNNEDTEDIVHEVFTKIYKLDKDKLPESNEASWLFTVSKNESYMFLRKSKPDISIEEIYEISGENNNIVSSNKRKMSNTFIVQQTENDIDKIIDADYFNGVISGLKEDEKQIISLKILSNFTFQKISQLLDIPIGTVQWKYYKAINSLKISISSLTGAVIAFVIVLLRRENLNQSTLKNKSSFDEVSKSDRLENDISSNDTVNKNSSCSSETKKENNLEDRNTENIINSGDSKINTVISEVKNYENTRIVKENIDICQIAFFSISIALLIIFIIFLKKYQQKLNRKSSKY